MTVGTEPAVDAAPAITVDAVESKKPKPKPTESVSMPYMKIELEYVMISG